MRYRLRTLLIVLALGPPVLSLGWTWYAAWRAEQQRQLKISELWAEGLLVDNQSLTRRESAFLDTMNEVEKLMEGTDTFEEPVIGFPWSEELQRRLESRKSTPASPP